MTGDLLPVDELVRREIAASIAVKMALLDTAVPRIVALARLIVDSIRQGGKLVLFGNGGSAADAQHVAAELVCRFRTDHDPLPAFALTTDSSILTAVGNDIAFEQVFARQVAALIRAGDVAVGISTSGRSPNVLAGIAAAKARGATTVGLTGLGGGSLKDIVDLCVQVPSDDTARIQEAHITIWHVVCELVEREFFGR